MHLPNFDRAQVEPRKVRDYLLSTTHPVGRFKARFFATLGYTEQNWQLLLDDLQKTAESDGFRAGQASPHGSKYELDAQLTGPTGKTAIVRVVWVVDIPTGVPKFVTAFPR
jgi:hypothetical protein